QAPRLARSRVRRTRRCTPPETPARPRGSTRVIETRWARLSPTDQAARLEECYVLVRGFPKGKRSVVSYPDRYGYPRRPCWRHPPRATYGQRRIADQYA